MMLIESYKKIMISRRVARCAFNLLGWRYEQLMVAYVDRNKYFGINYPFFDKKTDHACA